MHATRVRLAVLLALYGAAGLPPRTAQAAAPIVIPREAIERSGLVSLAELLAELPIAGSAVGRRYNSGGDGTEAIDLRDLGPERTLVLIDGRRALQDAFGRADLSTIPLAIVERIDVYPAGDAARFGADAVAGVVDVVTRRAVDGAEARAYLGGSSHGDGRVEAYDFAIGAAGERSDVTLVAAYEKFEPVSAGDRALSAVPLFGFGANDVRTGASSTTPFGRFGFGFNGNTLPSGGAGTVTLIPGRSGVAPSDFRPFDPERDGHNFAPENYVATPSQRSTLFASARHALTDSIDVHVAAQAGERRSAQQLAPFPISIGIIGLDGLRVPIPATSLYNPFGRDVTRAQFRPQVERRTFAQDVDAVRYELGLQGRFAMFERPWTWSLAARYAEREQHDTSRGLFDVARLRRGLGPSFRDAGGVPRCGTPDAPIDDCVPLNVFGGPDGFTREMYESVGVSTQDARSRRHVLYDGTLAGEWFDLPAGPILASLGVSHRRESGDEAFDALAASGAIAALAPPEAANGAFESDDAWLAATVPLLDGAALAERLEVDLAVRRIEVAEHGTTRASFGFRWQPFDSLLVSGSRAQLARAPSIAELFTGESDRFPSLVDPCGASSGSSPDVMERCRSGFGGVTPVPPGYESNNVQRRATTGGNPDLAPELGESTRFGLRWFPMEDGVSVWLEWSRLEIRDLIAPVTMQFVVDECYVRANEDACRHVVREGGFEPDGSFVGAMNTPRRIEREQVDVGARHAIATRFGEIALRADATWLAEHDEIPIPNRFFDAAAFEAAGLALDRGALFPRWRTTTSLDWQRGDLGATFALRHRSGLEESCVLPVLFDRGDLCSDPDGSARFPGGSNRIASATYVDISARWRAPWDAELQVGVRNAFDRAPPVARSGVIDSSYPEYDLDGRFWFASYSQRF